MDHVHTPRINNRIPLKRPQPPPNNEPLYGGPDEALQGPYGYTKGGGPLAPLKDDGLATLMVGATDRTSISSWPSTQASNKPQLLLHMESFLREGFSTVRSNAHISDESRLLMRSSVVAKCVVAMRKHFPIYHDVFQVISETMAALCEALDNHVRQLAAVRQELSATTDALQTQQSASEQKEIDLNEKITVLQRKVDASASGRVEVVSLQQKIEDLRKLTERQKTHIDELLFKDDQWAKANLAHVQRLEESVELQEQFAEMYRRGEHDKYETLRKVEMLELEVERLMKEAALQEKYAEQLKAEVEAAKAHTKQVEQRHRTEEEGRTMTPRPPWEQLSVSVCEGISTSADKVKHMSQVLRTMQGRVASLEQEKAALHSQIVTQSSMAPPMLGVNQFGSGATLRSASPGVLSNVSFRIHSPPENASGLSSAMLSPRMGASQLRSPRQVELCLDPKEPKYAPKGNTTDVPMFLRAEEMVRGVSLSKIQLSELMHSVHQFSRNQATSSVRLVSFEEVFSDWAHGAAAEMGLASPFQLTYSMVDCLHQNVDAVECQLFLRMLAGDVPPDTLSRLTEALATLRTSLAMHDNGEGCVTTARFREALCEVIPAYFTEDVDELVEAAVAGCCKPHTDLDATATPENERRLIINDLFAASQFSQLFTEKHIAFAFQCQVTMQDCLRRILPESGTSTLPLSLVLRQLSTNDQNWSQEDLLQFLSKCTYQTVAEVQDAGTVDVQDLATVSALFTFPRQSPTKLTLLGVPMVPFVVSATLKKTVSGRRRSTIRRTR